MSTLHKLMLATGMSLLIPGVAHAQRISMRGQGVCPWGMQIMRQQQQQQMMWQYKQQQHQAHLSMQTRQKQQYQHIQKTIQPGPMRKVSSPAYVRPSPPQVVKRPASQPIVRQQTTREMVKKQVEHSSLKIHRQERTVAVHLHWMHRPEGPGEYCTLSRAEILALFRLIEHRAKWHTAHHTLEHARLHHEKRVSMVPHHKQLVKHAPPVVHQPHHVVHKGQPQHQQHAKAKTVAQLQVALKVHKKTTDHVAMAKMNTNITILDIRCARCHQRMHGQPNMPHMVAKPHAHPPLHQPLVKAPVPLNNPLAKAPAPFKNPLPKNAGPFNNPLAKDRPVLNNPLAKVFKQPLQQGIPNAPPVAMNQPVKFPQAQPMPMAFAKLQPPALTLAIPALTPTPMNLNQPWRSGPYTMPGQNPFAGTSPGLLLPAMVSGKPATSQEWSPFAKPAGTTPSSGLPGDSPFDLATGIQKQPADKSEALEQSPADPSSRDLLQPDFPPLPPSVLLLRPRMIPRAPETGPEYSPLRWIAEHTPATGNRGS